MTSTRTDTGRVLQWALGFTGLALALVGASFVAGAAVAGTATTALLAVAILVLALLQGVLIAGLRSEPERIKRDVERV
jgi:uncharacterized membrane protein YoaK (UPF0700 family)